VASWSFLTSHARALLCIARDPGARLRDVAVSLGIPERGAYGIGTDLTAAGYIVKQKRRPPQPRPDPSGPRILLNRT
jgi:DNA-binding IclR family transcriptional regulator